MREGAGEALDFGYDFGERTLASLGKGIRSIAIGAAQIARREPHKDARQPGEGAFALQAQVDFIDDQRVGHTRTVTADRALVNLETEAGMDISSKSCQRKGRSHVHSQPFFMS